MLEWSNKDLKTVIMKRFQALTSINMLETNEKNRKAQWRHRYFQQINRKYNEPNGYFRTKKSKIF